MSNNKQTMKLYTKEDFLKAAEFCEVSMIDAKYIVERIDEVSDPIELPSDSLCINCDKSESTHNICMDCIIKIGKENIELPSEEEIYIEAQIKKDNIKKLPFDSASFIFGAMWLKDKIQGGNK